MRKGYTTDFFNQFEELSNKLDSLFEENKKLKLEHKKELAKLKYELIKEFREEKSELNETIKSLRKELEEANKLIKKLQEDNDRLRNQNNKNSTNSSKHSSTNISTPKKKTSANEYNYRIITEKKVGAQFGHEGHGLNKKKIEELIKSKKVEVRSINHKIKGKNTKENIIKYRVGIKIKTYVEKHTFIYSENAKESLPEEFYSDVTYDNSIKALLLELGAYNVVSYNRMSDLLNVITNDTINISEGTIVNFLYEFGDKCKKTLSNLEESMTRGADVLVVTNRDIKNDKISQIINVPDTNPFLSPILSVIPLQLFAYYIAKNKKLDVDKPRNLAKSVTVE